MELSHLRYFYEVARHGGFTAAARGLRVSQPSLSKAVKGLEDRQGVKLFDRSRTGVELTPVGKCLYRTCQEIFGKVEEANQLFTNEREVVSGDLDIGGSDNLCNYLLPEMLRKFLLKYPLVRPSLFNGSSAAILREIREGVLELGIFHNPPKDGGFVVEKLSGVRFSLVIAPAGRRARPPTLKDVAEKGIVGCRLRDYSTTFPIWDMLESNGIRPRFTFESNSQETQKRLALLGLGFAIVPSYMVAEEVEDGRLVEVRTPRPMKASILLAHRKGRTLSRAGGLFQDFLRKGIPCFE